MNGHQRLKIVQFLCLNTEISFSETFQTIVYWWMFACERFSCLAMLKRSIRVGSFNVFSAG